MSVSRLEKEVNYRRYDDTGSEAGLMHAGSTRGHDIGESQVDKIDWNDAPYNHFSLCRAR